MFDWEILSLEEKLGQLICVRYPENWPLIEKMLAEGKIGAVSYRFPDKSNEETADFINRLQRISRYPLIVGWYIPQGTKFPVYMALGATRSAELAYLYGQVLTRESKAVGYNWIPAPNLDININPDNPIINTRSLGEDVALVVNLGLETCRAIIDNRGLTCCAHFPGHGASSCDSHIKIPVIDRSMDDLRQVELKPYAVGIAEDLINCVETNHIHYSAIHPEAVLPATFSRRIINDLLRRELRFKGLITSDSLTMKAIKDKYSVGESAVRAVAAGHDIILQDYESDPRITFEALVESVRSGEIPMAQIDASVARIFMAKEWLGLYKNRYVDVENISNQVGIESHRQVARRIAEESITVLEDRNLPVKLSGEKKVLVVSNTDIPDSSAVDLGHLAQPGNLLLNDYISARHPNTSICLIGNEPSEEEVNRVLREARAAYLVIVGVFTRVWSYHEDKIRVSPEYQRIIKGIINTRRPVILLILGNPYVVRDLPRVEGCLCSYDGDCPYSIEAAVKVLFGEIEPQGKLPVTISDRYVYGYGRR